MARRLEGKTFVAASNNGVLAIAPAFVEANRLRRRHIEVWFVDNIYLAPERIKEKREMIANVQIALNYISVTPVFTFTRPDRVKEDPWFTGDYDLSTALMGYICEEGGEIKMGLYVPFSNGMETGMHGLDAQRSELAYVTTESQFEEAFGITIRELHERAAAVK